MSASTRSDLDRSVVVSRAWTNRAHVAAKRAFDVVASALLLAVLSPLLLVLATLVRLTSPGPVFYQWKVIGKNGRPFMGYKFRSMVANADDLKDGLEPLNEMT